MVKNLTYRWIFLVLILIPLGNVIPVSAKTPISLKLWHIWGDLYSFNKAVTNFNKAYPHIILDIESTSYGYDTKIKTAIAANEAPDIFFSWGGGFSAPFVRSGKVLPLDPYLNDGTRNKLIKGSLTNFTYDGKVYALPTTLSIGVLYCNQELFDKYSIKIPVTFEELVTAVKKFNEKGILPIAVGERDLWPGMFWYDILALRIAGAKRSHEALTKKASFNQPEFTEAAAKLVELIRLNGFGNRALTQTLKESIILFNRGKAAMMFNGTWFSGECIDEDCKVKGKIVAKKFPLVEGGKGTDTEYLGGPSDSFMVSANSKHKKEAVMAVKYICETMSKESYLMGMGLPLWKIDVKDTSKINPLILEQAEMIKNVTAYVSWWDVFLQGDDANIHKSLVQKLFAGTITPEQYSKEMQKLNLKKK